MAAPVCRGGSRSIIVEMASRGQGLDALLVALSRAGKVFQKANVSENKSRKERVFMGFVGLKMTYRVAFNNSRRCHYSARE